MKAFIGGFTSWFTLALVGLAVYAALTVGEFPAPQAAAAGAGLFVFISVLGGLLQSNRVGLF